MEYALRRFFPRELIDIICKMVWELRIKEVNKQIRENIIWIYLPHDEWHYTFMISNSRNYYSGLEFFEWAGASH